MKWLFDVYLTAWLCLLLSGVSAVAKEIRVSPADDWFSVLQGDGLAPGDTLVLQQGVYTDRRLLSVSHRGTKEKPVVIRGEGAVFKRPDARQNSMNLVGVQYLVMKDLEITGGDAAIRISGTKKFPAKFITLDGLHIHHIGGVGVTCNHEGNTYEGMHFLRNHIHHTGGHGEAFYLGGNNAKAIFHSGAIELNYLHDLKGPGVSQGDGIEIKHGSWGNVVRDNVIHDTKYPGVIVYGTKGKAVNVIERNLIWNTGDQGIQAASDATIEGNLIVYPRADGIHCKTHQGAKPGNLLIRNNIVRVKGRSHALRINRPEGGYTKGISVRDNRFEHEGHGLAIRVQWEEGKVLILGNRGTGRVDAVKLGVHCWDGSAGIQPIKIRVNQQNPAWKILDPERLSWMR